MGGSQSGRYPSDPSHLVVEGRKVQANRHVFSEQGRHLGTVESITVELDHPSAVELVTDSMDYDVDRNDDYGITIVQGWDSAVIEEQGFIDGTMSVRLEHV